MKFSLSRRPLVLALCVYAAASGLTWHLIQSNVSAQTSCAVPRTMGEVNRLTEGRWESFQRVTVKLYPGHFTRDEQTEIRNVLSEFQSAGQTRNCSQVSFVSVSEQAFPITSTSVGNLSDIDTLYIYRRPISEMPKDAAGLGGNASIALDHYKWKRVWLKLRTDVTLIASKALFKGVLRHELGHSFWLFDEYSSPCSVTMMCSRNIVTTEQITDCDNFKLSAVYCQIAATPTPGGNCTPPPTGRPPVAQECLEPGDCNFQYEMWNTTWCRCTCRAQSPVLVDVAGDGLRLTDSAGGVSFDLDSDGAADRLGWTQAGSDDAWLALDRDSDGRITDGRELFGNFTPQPEPAAGAEPNGFLALAEFDRLEGGGNGDGVIDSGDVVFTGLRLWQDANHDGVSQPEELYALQSLDVARLHLDYKASRRVDGHGNQFKYRAKVDDAKGAKAGRWAWDVFLVAQ
jgi:hypothetical protein